MKKYALLMALGVLAVAGYLFATVGGPTYISEIAFNKAENSVYYIENSSDGRGCPPIIHKINILTLGRSEVKSCDQLFSELSDIGEELEGYDQFRRDIYQGMPYLGSVSLKKNNIDVKLKFLSEELMEGFDEAVWREFEATVTQDDREVGKINFRGCSKDQPHIFEGYMIPETNAMAMLISNKGDCFEGGYVEEVLHIIKGITYYNTDPVRSYKEVSATEPNTGNMVVYATEDRTLKPDSAEAVYGPKEFDEGLLFVASSLIILLVVGYFLRKKFNIHLGLIILGTIIIFALEFLYLQRSKIPVGTGSMEDNIPEQQEIAPVRNNTYTYKNHGITMELPVGFVPHEEQSESGPAYSITLPVGHLSYVMDAAWWEKYNIPVYTYVKDKKIGENIFKIYEYGPGNNNFYWYKRGNVGYEFSATGNDKLELENMLKTFRFIGWAE